MTNKTETEQTENVKEFVRANKRSAVVEGWAHESNPANPPKGATYRLKSGKTFSFTAEECKTFIPDWKF